MNRIGPHRCFATLLITPAVCWKPHAPVADWPLVLNLDSEILDPPSRFQLRDQPARLLATSGPSLCGLIRIAVISGVLTGTADALTLGASNSFRRSSSRSFSVWIRCCNS